MIQVSFRTNIGFVALRIAVISADDLAGALQAQEGFTIRPLPDYLRDGITRAEPDYSPIPFPALTAPKELIHFDRLGAAMKYMLPTHADVNDTFVQTLGTIGLSVRKGFDWQGLDKSTLDGLRRAAPWSSRSPTSGGKPSARRSTVGAVRCPRVVAVSTGH